jgi:membrane-bound metal-dependent hydrolase YbcI (DUF457 family)
MPFTPFHFGPGALLQTAAPRHVSFLGFCAANVLIDTEPLYFMLTGQDPLHRFFHTYVGATLAMAATVAIFLLALRLARRIRLPDVLGWQGLTRRQVLGGAVAGSYSHIVLDSIMHADIRPFSPFSQANGLYGLISIEVLQWLCVACAALVMVFLVVTRRRQPQNME